MKILFCCLEVWYIPLYLTFYLPYNSGDLSSQASEHMVDISQTDNVGSQPREPQNGASWVDIFVQEMMNASDWDDVRGRAMKILEGFEKNVVAQTASTVEVRNLNTFRTGGSMPVMIF